MFKNKYDTIMI